MRFFGLLFLAVFAASAVAQSDPDPRGGWFEITSGRVRQPDGTYRSLVGRRIPFIVEPANKPKGYVPSSFQFGSNQDTLQFVYNSDRPAAYFGSGFDTPSALDDIQTTALAIGLPWSQVTFGWRIPNRNIPFFVFGSYDNYLGDQGAGNSSFSGIITDTFGGPFWQVTLPQLFPTVPGEYMITFDISTTGIIQTDDHIYTLQQFRSGNENGPFMMDWAPFFSGGGPPAIGNSNDIFWYDSDFNGVYEYAEQDLFNDPGNQITGFEANFAMSIKVDSNTQTSELPPSSMTVLQGTLQSGNYLSTWTSNNQHAIINNIDTDSEDFNPIQAVFSTFAPSNNVLSLQVTVETSSDVANQIQELCMFNYALNTWVVVKSTATTTSDVTITHVQGINPGQFVRTSDQEMKLMVRARDNAAEVDVWREKIDLVKWRVTTL